MYNTGVMKDTGFNENTGHCGRTLVSAMISYGTRSLVVGHIEEQGLLNDNKLVRVCSPSLRNWGWWVLDLGPLSTIGPLFQIRRRTWGSTRTCRTSRGDTGEDTCFGDVKHWGVPDSLSGESPWVVETEVLPTSVTDGIRVGGSRLLMVGITVVRVVSVRWWRYLRV